ncbi:MAG: aldehyde dehydrogenase family protein [Planctomycetaceae bacterium]|nr:aldehyde dehydrogenase family protein [Planctomycetaceae bacterium]
MNPADNLVQRSLSQLQTGSDSFPLAERIAVCQECLARLAAVGEEWGRQAAVSKGFAADSPMRGEDIMSGPCVIARQLHLTIQTLQALQRQGRPRLPGAVRRNSAGVLTAGVFPTHGLFDPIAFMGLHGEVRMQSHVLPEQIHGDLPQQVLSDEISGLCAVLGAGNVSSIPATDTLNKVMFDGQRVALKLNPVNDYLSDVLARAFAPLIDRNLLRLISGGAAVGAELISAADVTEVHITGSLDTMNAILWGNDNDAQQRQRENRPVLQKPITGELGNVTPWIVVPGEYSLRQLRSQAEHIAASITNNASFNCLATKVIVTSRTWRQREQFLDLIGQFLSATPTRPAYYPGAADRFRRYAQRQPAGLPDGHLPWTLLTDQTPAERPELFAEESFVCVCAETALEESEPERFLEVATQFVNERLLGTLCASVTVPADFRTQHVLPFEQALQTLQYGTVCVNQWAGPAYGLISPPWGGYPLASNHDSGIGSVHNTYLLQDYEKTVLYGPLVDMLRPVWFPSHRNGLKVAQSLLHLYARPSIWRVPRLGLAAGLGV